MNALKLQCISWLRGWFVEMKVPQDMGIESFLVEPPNNLYWQPVYFLITLMGKEPYDL